MANGFGRGQIRRFSLLLISFGVVLIVVSIVNGAILLVAFAKLADVSFANIYISVWRVAYEFLLPFIGGILMVISGSTSLETSMNGELRREQRSHRAKVAEARESMINRMLNIDERRILDMVKKSPDGALQSSLVIESGYSKVKMHRILKRLELKGLIRRGRAGITNRVFIDRV